MIITRQNHKYLVDEATGEMVSSTTNPKLFDHVEHRAKAFYYLHMYRRHAHSKSLKLCCITSQTAVKKSQITTNELSSTLRSNFTDFKPLPNSTVSDAQVYKTGSAAHVFRGLESGKAHFGGVAKCSNVWACPVCSQRITTKRADILKQMTDKHTAAKGFTYLVTLTVPHGKTNQHKTQKLRDFVLDMTSSYRSLTSSRIYNDFKQSFIGSVRSFEATYGEFNGWHPHFHILVFAKHKLLYEDIRRVYYDEWSKQLLKRGYFIDPKMFKILVDVRGGADAAMYVSKMGDTKSQWQLSDEITKSNRKEAKQTKNGIHYTPFSMLKLWADNAYDKDCPERKFLYLYREYEKAFFGKNQLVVTKGLYKYFDIDTKSDALLNNEIDEKSQQLASLSFQDWHIVAKNNLFAQVLTAAETDNLAAFLSFLPLFDANPRLSLNSLFKVKDVLNSKPVSDFSLTKGFSFDPLVDDFSPRHVKYPHRWKLVQLHGKNVEINIDTGKF
ncbi:MAG: protein rep [Bacteroidales bacterium]|nr:protein rep [Bacteroidales bacterium]